MATSKEALDQEIEASLAHSKSPVKAVRKLFTFKGRAVLEANSLVGFEILNAVSERFNVPFRSLAVVGSAHTGYSYFKQRDFVPKESDLDLAIVDSALFLRYCELSFQATDGYTDLTAFGGQRDAPERFKNYIFRGVFRPDLMPLCAHKRDWFAFFNQLGNKYSDLFDGINCGIYQSEVFFEAKQLPLIAEYRKGKQ